MGGHDEPGIWRCSGYIPGHGLTRPECLALRQAVRHLSASSQQGASAASSRSPGVCWYPRHGCALVALGPPGEGEEDEGGVSGDGSEGDGDDVEASASTLALMLVCLDGWESEPHCYHSYGGACPSG